MKQVFLHIGTQKTGSSSIQFFLHSNRERLTELGYLYPSEKKTHHNLAYTLLGDPKADHKSNTWEDIIAEIDNSKLDKIIISSEFFAQSSKIEFIEKIAAYLAKYQTKIIVYLKRQDKKVESSFNQQMKTGVYAGTVEFFLKESKSPNYLKMLDNWGQVFGRENIIVRSLEKEQIPDIYQDFLKNIGIASLDGFTKTEDRNIKPNIDQISAINFINQKIASKLDLKKQGFNKLNRQPKDLVFKNYPKSFFKYTQHWQASTKYNLIPCEKALEILEQCQEQNSQIAKQYLNREDGRLFYEPLEKYEHEPLTIENLNKEQLIDLCSYILKKQPQWMSNGKLKQKADESIEFNESHEDNDFNSDD
jgi:hypothetical protein